MGLNRAGKEPPISSGQAVPPKEIWHQFIKKENNFCFLEFGGRSSELQIRPRENSQTKKTLRYEIRSYEVCEDLHTCWIASRMMGVTSTAKWGTEPQEVNMLSHLTTCLQLESTALGRCRIRVQGSRFLLFFCFVCYTESHGKAIHMQWTQISQKILIWCRFNLTIFWNLYSSHVAAFPALGIAVVLKCHSLFGNSSLMR